MSEWVLDGYVKLFAWPVGCSSIALHSIQYVNYDTICVIFKLIISGDLFG